MQHFFVCVCFQWNCHSGIPYRLNICYLITVRVVCAKIYYFIINVITQCGNCSCSVQTSLRCNKATTKESCAGRSVPVFLSQTCEHLCS